MIAQTDEAAAVELDPGRDERRARALLRAGFGCYWKCIGDLPVLCVTWRGNGIDPRLLLDLAARQRELDRVGQ